tara:strand:- start:16047 stop:16322 length:276 start_codon:yes stop_codon:yes gene_type:complete
MCFDEASNVIEYHCSAMILQRFFKFQINKVRLQKSFTARQQDFQKFGKAFKGLKLGTITSMTVEPFKGLLVFTNLFKMPVHFEGLYGYIAL